VVLAYILNLSVALTGVSASAGGDLLGTISFFHPWPLY